MTDNQLKQFLLEPISTAEGLAEFIECAKQGVPLRDENLVVNIALDGREHHWRSEVVQAALGNAQFESRTLGVVFRLLACATLTPELLDGLSALFGRSGAHLLKTELIFKLITTLHQRGVLRAREVLLPRLGLFSNIGLWENAIMVFRVCDPSLLENNRVMLIPRIRSARCRVLLQLLSADLAAGPSQPRTRLQRAVRNLANLSAGEHTWVVMDLAWVGMFEGPRLSSAVAREMAVLGDRREIQYLQSIPNLWPS